MGVHKNLNEKKKKQNIEKWKQKNKKPE